MNKIVKTMVISAAVLLAGCSQKTAEEAENNQVKEEKEMECAYSQEDVALIKEVLECEEKRAKAILEVLAEVNICGVEKAEKADAEEGYAFLMTDKSGGEYKVFVDKKYYLYAVKDAKSDKYIYTEYE